MTRRRPPKREAGRRLGTSEARAELPDLVRRLAAQTKPSRSMADNAVEIGPHRKGGAWLVSEVDAQATLDALAAQEEELENIALGFLIQERLAGTGKTTPAEDVIRELGFADLLEDLPGAIPR